MINDIIKETTDKMKSAVSYFEEELQGIRTGRASPGLVERLPVEYYGSDAELRTLASISTPEAQQILIRPYDKNAVKAIEKAISAANIGLTPNVDGDSIRLNMPPLTRERRQELVKVVGKRTEEARVSVRNIRRNANDEIKEYEKEKLISEDEAKRGQDEVQKLTDKYIAELEELAKNKEQEILEV